MERFLGHVVATIIDNERSKRRQQDQQQRQHTLPVLDDVAIEASRKASAPAASNDREHSSSAGQKQRVRCVTSLAPGDYKNAEGHVANGCSESGCGSTILESNESKKKGPRKYDARQ